mgnify:CR=1 FL=1
MQGVAFSRICAAVALAIETLSFLAFLKTRMAWVTATDKQKAADRHTMMITAIDVTSVPLS